MKVLNAEQMRAADQHAIEVLKIPSISLMENAATQVARVMLQRYPQPRVSITVCGKGNNGGDGLAVARLLRQHGWNSTAVLLDASSAFAPDPAENWKRAIHAGVRCLENVSIEQLTGYLNDSEVVVDALFGTGLKKGLEGKYADAVEAINGSGKEIIAIDVPSGLSSDSGDIPGRAVHATATVALAALKFCHVLPPASELSGEIYVVDIGIPTGSGTSVIRAKDIAQLLPYRKPDSHKGTYGHAVIIAGSTGKSGAAFLSAKGALRGGAGLSTAVVTANVQQAITSLNPEIMTRITPGNPDFLSPEASTDVLEFLKEKNAVAIGPGIGTKPGTFDFVQTIIPQIEAPVVIDADGLNLLAQDIGILSKRKPGSTVLTPHPGEMARLLNSTTSAVQKDRMKVAKELAAKTKSIVVLKGYRTIIADPQGETWLNITGGQALASGGTGDVLTGVIAGYIAQKLPPLQAAIVGVFAHGLTGNLFEKEFPQQSLNALDIFNYWNQAIRLIQTEQDLEGEYLKLHLAF